MQRIEKGDENNTALAADLIERIDTSDRVEKEEIEIPPYEEISMPERGKFVFPPIWDRVTKRGEKLNKRVDF